MPLATRSSSIRFGKMPPQLYFFFFILYIEYMDMNMNSNAPEEKKTW